MIPKIIHYCWVGDSQIPKSLQKCIASWKKCCPNYEIKRWDESNYDFGKNKYMKQAYESKKWGFVPDFARLDIIYNNGGIYLDTDVEVIRPLDDLLDNYAFAGCESIGRVALGLGFGAEKGNQIIAKLLDSYSTLSFINDDGSFNLTPSPTYQSELLKQYGLIDSEDIQNLKDITVYPKSYFNPVDLNTGDILINNETHTIHHYAATWLDKKSKIRYSIHKFLNRTIGTRTTDWIRNNILRKN